MATAATRAERDQRIERVDAIRRSLRQGVSTDKRAVEVESKAVRWTEWLRRRLKALGGGDPVRLLPDAIAEVEQHAAEDLQAVTLVQPEQQWAEMGNLLGQKRRKVGRLQRQAARCFLVTQEASSVERRQRGGSCFCGAWLTGAAAGCAVLRGRLRRRRCGSTVDGGAIRRTRLSSVTNVRLIPGTRTTSSLPSAISFHTVVGP